MKSLLIVANPSKTSFTHSLARGYAENHPDCEVLDLYELGQEIFAYESMEKLQKGEDNSGGKRNLVQEKIKEADEIVLFFPVWWGSMPAILKNFFDVNFSSGFAFQPLEGGKIKKLLKGKIAKIYCHCDAPSFVYKIPFLAGINIKWYISRAILGFCGVKTTHFELYGNITKGLSKEKKQDIISNI